MKIPFKIRLLLWWLNRQKGPQLQDLTPEQARRSIQRKSKFVEPLIDYPAIALARVFDCEVAGRDGDIPVRIYQANKGENLPIIVYIHGGGFVLRSIDSHDKVCRRLSRDNRAVVISIGYRLAPEHPFPAAVHDCYDVVKWVKEAADVHGGDTSRLVLMGDSAGGNLSTAVCLMSRDLGGPEITYQVLIYPCTDGTLSAPSIRKYGEGYLLTEKMMHWFLGHYKSKEEDIHSPYLSVLLAKDLSNLPPAFVLTAEYDPLKDEGKQYAERLMAAGNEVIYKDYGGMIHGFVSMPKMSKRVLDVYRDIQQALTPVLAKSKKQSV
ncbi:MAG: alpha/beta hydrolase [Bacteroidota bacterium]